MRTYSPFFHTLHDDPAPVGVLRAQTTILRAVIPVVVEPPCEPEDHFEFHDFAVLWDDDHDERIIFILERLYVCKLLQEVLAIGEHKGHVALLLGGDSVPVGYAHKIEHECIGAMPSDFWSVSVGSLGATAKPWGMGSFLVRAGGDSARDYLLGLRSLWQLGTKDASFTIGPFQRGTVCPNQRLQDVLESELGDASES